jgi:4-hydroxy-4-methyl-2-oxoglutarate aldolase
MFTQERRNEIRKRFETVDTANVADVLDTLGYMDCGLSQEFMPFPANGARLAGWAYTIRGQMSPFPLGGDAKKMEACNGISEGEISVWSGDGKGICYFGELIALGMRERGSVGALVDGGIRDVRWIGEHGIAVYARYRTPVQSIGRWMVTDYQVPVYVRGATSSYVRVRPGDFILADEDGAILIPVEVVEKVLEEAEHLTATEVQIRAELAKGLTLAQALQKYGHV